MTQNFFFIRQLQISHNAPYLPPKIFQKHCFQFLLGRLQYPEEMKNKGYAKMFFFWGGGGEMVHDVIFAIGVCT